MAELRTPSQRVQAVRVEQCARWLSGAPVPVEELLGEHPELLAQAEGALQIIYQEVLLRQEQGETPQLDEYVSRFPQFADRLRPLFAVHALLEAGSPAEASHPAAAPPASLREQAAALADAPEVPGYVLLGRLGHGGMGVVYRARQRHLKREVALKVISAGAHADPDERQRFRLEAQAQAQLQHPHIVQIFEIGEADGCPYLALELVEGGSLARQVAGTPQPPPAAAHLVETLARTMHHAHQRGLVHCDLKPANILLTADGVPKIGDFGLARWLHGEIGQSGSGAVRGTPSYMAPEQAGGRGRGIGPATDVYALGAILYELLTGRPPFLAETPLETVQQVRDKEPVPVRRLQPKVPRDLETICLQCLHKDPARRYADAEGLAGDLRRFQEGKPIAARPVGWPERGWKWARRRPAVAALVGIAVLLVLGGLASTWWYAERERHQADQERAQRKRTEQAERRAQTVLTFFQDKVLAAPRPEGQDGGLGREVTILAALVAAEPQIAQEFADEPIVEASVRGTMGRSYYHLGKYELAIRQYERALALRQQTLGPDHPETLVIMNDLALAYREAGKTNKAVALFEQAHDASVRQRGPDHPETLVGLGNLAGAYLAVGEMAKAIALFEQLRDALVRQLGATHPDTLILTHNLAVAYKNAGQTARATALFEQVRDAQVRQLGPEHPDTLATLNNLAGAYQAAGQIARAIALFEQVRDARVKELGPDHPLTLITLHNLALAYQDAGRTAKALALLEQVRDAKVRKLGPSHPETLTTLNSLGEAYRRVGRMRQAIVLFEQVRDAKVKELGPDHPSTLDTLHSLATAYGAAGQTDKAIPLLEQVRDARVRRLGPDHPQTLATLGNLADVYRVAGQTAQAIAMLEQVRDARVKKLGPDHPDTLGTLNNLGVAYLAAGQAAQAVALFEQLRDLRVKKLGADHPDTLTNLANLARAYQVAGKKKQALSFFQQAATGIEKHEFVHQHAGPIIESLSDCHERLQQYAPAEAWRRKWLAFVEQRDGPESATYAEALTGLGRNLLLQQNHVEAEKALGNALAIHTKQDPDTAASCITKSLLGSALLGQHKYALAEPLLLQGYEGLKRHEQKLSPHGKMRLQEAREHLMQLYDAWGKKDQADRWRQPPVEPSPTPTTR